jgi:hypothetical protein
MTFHGVMKVGDLVRLREAEDNPSSQRMGTGLVVKVESNPLDQPRRYPVIQVKFLKSEEILRFIEKDLTIINEA